jgi:His-Xaa-Ser system radical SAM maturase HxsB
MSKFSPREAFAPSDPSTLELLPLRFEPLSGDRYLITNEVGDHLLATKKELNQIVNLDLHPGDGLYERAYSHNFIHRKGNAGQLHLLAMRLRSRMAFLQYMTPLHIFVVTLRCEHSCPYCQVSRRSSDKSLYDMDEQIALRALDIALSAPGKYSKLEFQGGEPLLNFALIKKIVVEAEKRGSSQGKTLEFVITSNLALIDDAILDFCKHHRILISTSLDGPADLHNRNRPRPGNNSHELAVAGIRRAQEALGRDHVGALMTTTEASLSCPEEIIDEYIRLGLRGIFLRPLSPYGFAVKTKWIAAYDSPRWIAFYERGLRYILELNKKGSYFPEFYASLLLQRLLTDRSPSYVDLRSPAGTGLGALVYNYDGAIFASDEGRMLAEMNDRTFEIGQVQTDDYRSLMLSDKLLNIVSQSLTQCAPMCSTCAYEPFCGADPVYHHATQGDYIGIKPLSNFCARQKSVLTFLIDLLENSPDDARILKSWVPR